MMSQKPAASGNRRPFLSLAGILCSILCLLFLTSSCRNREKIYKKSRIAMDTLVTITVASGSDREAEAAIDRAFMEIDNIGKLLNFFSSDSEVSLINKFAGIKPIRVTKETFEVIENAVYIAENTEGAFDITIGPVSSLYDFHAKTLPDNELIRKRLKFVGYKNIVLDKSKSTVFLKKRGMMIDPGGITKGYAADKAAEVLKSLGIKSGIVAAAGDIKTFGTKPGGTPWNIGIKNPRQTDSNDEIFAVVHLSNMAISTSGDYERFFIKNGVRYHHILDPKTGRPVYKCRSATIITKKGAFADALSTGIFVLGPEKGISVLKRLGFDGVIIDSAGNIHVTEGIKGKIEIKGKKP